MLKQNLRSRFGLVFVFGFSLLCLGVCARADDDRGDNHRNQGDNHSSQRDRYHYREGHWYGQGDVIVSDVPVGSEIESLPPQYTTVVVGDNSYYYDNTRYYSRSPDGAYVVVERPVVVERQSSPLIQIKL
jgi:hypothetical protein